MILFWAWTGPRRSLLLPCLLDLCMDRQAEKITLLLKPNWCNNSRSLIGWEPWDLIPGHVWYLYHSPQSSFALKGLPVFRSLTGQIRHSYSSMIRRWFWNQLLPRPLWVILWSWDLLDIARKFSWTPGPILPTWIWLPSAQASTSPRHSR